MRMSKCILRCSLRAFNYILKLGNNKNFTVKLMNEYIDISVCLDKHSHACQNYFNILFSTGDLH